eukprot:3896668-Prymnesium_polylepis.1
MEPCLCDAVRLLRRRQVLLLLERALAHVFRRAPPHPEGARRVVDARAGRARALRAATGSALARRAEHPPLTIRQPR